MVDTSTSNVGGLGLIPGGGGQPKNQNIKQKQYCKQTQYRLSKWFTSKIILIIIKTISFFITVLNNASDGKESACNGGDTGLIPESGRSSGERNGYPLQYSCLENSMDRERSQVGYSPWGCKESDTPAQLTLSLFQFQKLLFSQPVIFWLMSNYFSLFPPSSLLFFLWSCVIF